MSTGLPRRTVEQDANEGIVYPPTKKETATQISGNTTARVTSTAAAQGIGNLANAIQKRADAENEMNKEKRLLRAAARQGASTAINEVDRQNKRTGFIKGLFGEDTSYRKAQQMAASNKAREMYIEDLNQIDEYSYMQPEQYNTLLQERLSSQIESYEEDEETRLLVTDTWMKNAQTLAEKQQANHIVWTQQQARAAFSRNIQLNFDASVIESEQAYKQEDYLEIQKRNTDLFSGKAYPQGMSPAAGRSVVYEELLNSLRTGNIGPLRAAQSTDFLKNLTREEQIAFNEAVNAYDSQHNDQVINAYETAELAIEGITSDADAEQVVQDLIAQLDTLTLRASGTPKSQLNLTRGRKQLWDMLDQQEQDTLLGLKDDIELVENKYNLQLEKATTAEERLEIAKQKEAELADLRRTKGTESKKALNATLSAQVEAMKSVNAQYKTIETLADERQKLFEAALKDGNTALANFFNTTFKQAEDAMNVERDPAKRLEHWNGVWEQIDKMAQSIGVEEYTTENLMEALQYATDPVEQAKLQSALQAAQTKEKVSSKIRINQDEIEKLALAAKKKADEAAEEQSKINSMKDMFSEHDPIVKTSKQAKIDTDYNPTKSDYNEALTMSIVDDVTRLTGSELPLTVEQAIPAIMGSPAVADFVAAKLKKNPDYKSDIVNTLVANVLSGFEGMVDPETGKIADDRKVAIQSISRFAALEGQFKNMVGSDADAQFTILERGARMGDSVEKIRADMQKYENYKNNKGDYNIDWHLAKGESKTDRVTNLLFRSMGEYPNNATLAHYQSEYEIGLVINQGNRYAAEEYVRKSVQADSVVYKGNVIHGGQELNNVTQYTFSDLMDKAQELHGGVSLLSGYLPALGAKRAEGETKLYSLSQLSDPTIYTVAGDDGFYISSRNAQMPVHITAASMQMWEAQLKELQRVQSMSKPTNEQVHKAWVDAQTDIHNSVVQSLFGER